MEDRFAWEGRLHCEIPEIDGWIGLSGGDPAVPVSVVLQENSAWEERQEEEQEEKEEIQAVILQ